MSELSIFEKIEDDIEKDKTPILRKVFRHFIFYEKIKNFEKKYIRTGKTKKDREEK